MKFLVLLLVCASSALAKPEGRIVGGQVARGGQFPFSAALYVTKPGGTYFCGGALISNLWIITAAQCADSATSFRILLGSNTLEGNDPNRITVATASYVLHPNYNPQSFEHDIALVKLRLPIDFNIYVGAINLPTAFIPDYTTVTAIGWGQQNDVNAGISNDLTYVTLTTISNDECQLTYGAQISNNMLCGAGNYNEGTCNGDMGGVLIQTVGSSSVHIGTAIFTSQNGCETTDPSGFIRTIPYVVWIKNVTEIP